MQARGDRAAAAGGTITVVGAVHAAATTHATVGSRHATRGLPPWREDRGRHGSTADTAPRAAVRLSDQPDGARSDAANPSSRSLGSNPMRLIVARCEVTYAGRLSTVLPMAVRLLVLKSDGSVMVHADSGGYKPQNWMTAPTAIDVEGDPPTRIEVRKLKAQERLEIAIDEVLLDITHDMGEAAALEKDGVERDLQELLAAAPHYCGEGFRLVRREWPTDIGPVDLMCREQGDGWVAVEIKRVGTIEAVEQLSRYLERIRLDPAMGACRGVLVAQQIKAQASVLAAARGIACVEVDLEVLRGDREPELTLFG
jgi:endonuclease